MLILQCEIVLKENIQCPKSPEKVKTVRSKRQKLGESNDSDQQNIVLAMKKVCIFY